MTGFLENPFSEDALNIRLDGVNGDILLHFPTLDFRYWEAGHIYLVIFFCRLVSCSRLSIPPFQ
jgi:hypothetical protein